MEKYWKELNYHSDKALSYLMQQDDIAALQHLKALEHLRANGHSMYIWYMQQVGISGI